MADRLRDPLPAGITTALRWAFVVVCGLSLVLGFIGLRTYILTHPEKHYGHTLSDLIYDDLDLFPLQSPPAMNGGSLPVALAIARFSAPCVLAYTVFEIAVSVSAHRIGRVRMRRYRGHAVVCGSSRMAAVLTEQLRRQRHRVITIEPGPEDRRRPDVVIGDPAVPARLREAAVEHASVVYCCLPDSDRNVEIAGTIDRIRDGRPHPTRVHAMVQDLDLCLALKAQHWSAAGPDRHPYVDFFTPDELAAREIVRTDDPLFTEDPPRVAIAGSGAFGRSVLVELGRQWLIRRKHTTASLQVTLLGDRARAAASATTERYGFLDEVCHIQTRTGTPADFLAERNLLAAPRLHRLYLCQEDEGQALGTALDAVAHLSSAVDKIVVRLNRMSGMARALDTATGPGALFAGLGTRLRVVDVAEFGCDPAAIGMDLAEVLARSGHQRYLLERLAGGAAPGSAAALHPWETLDEDHRAASRAQAFDVGRKVAAIGCLLVPRTAADRAFEYEPDEIEALAKREHKRWMQERIGRGWQLGPRDEAKKQHPDLVPWADLSETSREIDREAVRAIPGVLAELGLAIVRIGARPRPDDGAHGKCAA